MLGSLKEHLLNELDIVTLKTELTSIFGDQSNYQPRCSIYIQHIL